MKYKVGDRVRIKSLDWYNENKNDKGNVVIVKNGVEYHFTDMDAEALCGKEVIIVKVLYVGVYLFKGIDFCLYTDEMIEGLVEDENNHLTEVVVDTVRESNDRHRIVIDPRFDIEVDEGEYYAVRRKREYPKTYEECLKILGIKLSDCYIQGYKSPLLEDLQELLICRDAYWKIAGDWKPEFRFGKKKYCIMTKDNKVINATVEETNRILVFPTAEMRDAFKENFKELIEECKELL